LLAPGRFFSFLILYTIGRTTWTGDQAIARPLHTQGKHKHRMNTYNTGPHALSGIRTHDPSVRASHGGRQEGCIQKRKLQGDRNEKRQKKSNNFTPNEDICKLFEVNSVKTQPNILSSHRIWTVPPCGEADFQQLVYLCPGVSQRLCNYRSYGVDQAVNWLWSDMQSTCPHKKNLRGGKSGDREGGGGAWPLRPIRILVNFPVWNSVIAV
jgi:hypothetical protein